ncbi:SAV_2336 N-terminal domain-related protein [Actinoplanes sp. NPDC023801]|uniref:SAV_2336 N-terminal domain-related protein n=1 Tax=Actinoplanes sp. NPDC023801 TaxID=3154595 RepID=UPI0033CB3B49
MTTDGLDRLLAVLDAAGVRLTPVEVAEALWLATREGLSGPAAAGPAVEEPPTVPQPVAEPVRSRPDAGTELRLPEPGTPPPARPDSDTGTGEGEGEAGPVAGDEVRLEAVPGWPLLARTAPALPNSGRTLHALRPLKRRSPSGRRVILDEDATAQQTAERRMWTPVWRPAPDRWLDLTLVLDHSSIDGVWNRLGQEAGTMLERLGAFRTMRVVRLGLQPDGTVGVVRSAAAQRSPARLVDRPGRHLVLLLSDCIGPPWHDGEMAQLLGRWSSRAPVAILQPLPERLWNRTGLAPIAGRLSAPRAGAPGADYSFSSAMRRRRLPEAGHPTPVLELDPHWLRPWADLVAGRAVGGIDAIVTAAGETGRGRGRLEPAAEATAEQRVRLFRAGASAPAWYLARYLSAAVPLNLAVMRLVQAVMVPGSRPVHLAEVLYGGLLEPDGEQFEFLPGVRQLLLGTLRQSEAGRVFMEVSDYVERHLELPGASFAAVMSAPGGSLTVPALRQPFAAVRADVLRRLTGSAVAVPATPVALPARRARERLTILHLDALEADPWPYLPPDVRPDLVVVTGGVAREAIQPEYQGAFSRLESLRTRMRLPPGRIVVVPGDGDVNLGLCALYFERCRADGLEPVPPYWPKWEPLAGFLGRVPGGTAFEQHQPWQLFEIPALRTVVAALNSTVPASHEAELPRDGLGDAQRAWFARRLRDYEGRGWLRVGVVHHDPADEATDLAAHLDVLLTGQPGGIRELGSTGLPVVGASLPHQVLDLRPGTLQVSSGTETVEHVYGDHWWLAETGRPMPPRAADDPADPARTSLLARVARAYRARHPQVSMVERRWLAGQAGYLIVSAPGRRECIGVLDGEPDTGVVRRFLDEVVRQESPGRDATLVSRSAPVGPLLPAQASAQGIRLLGFADFQVGEDVLRYAADQAASLEDDEPALTPGFYVPRPYTLLTGETGGADLRDVLRGWLSGPDGRLVAVAADTGMGKTFLLRELARQLHTDRDPVVPVLVDLRDLDWRVDIDELVAIRLSRGGVHGIDRERSRYLLGEGRVALLCDGLDDLVARAARDRLRERLEGWRAWARPDRAKLVLVSRDLDLLTDAFAPYRTADRVQRIRLHAFERGQILDALTRRLGPDRARQRLDLLDRVGGLAGMARNPRMLALIADIDDRLLASAASGGDPEIVASLYQGLIHDWLDGERRRAMPGELLLEDLWRAVTYLARRLWESDEAALGVDALGAAADVLTGLTDSRGVASPSRSATAALLGTGALLVRDEDYRFRFLDDSVLDFLVAQEIAGRLDPGRPAAVARLLRPRMSPLMLEFIAGLGGRERARSWAQAALGAPSPAGIVADVARRLLAGPAGRDAT